MVAARGRGLRDHLNLPVKIIGALLGIDGTTVSHATTLTRQLLAGTGIPLPPAAPPPGIRPRTPADLREYATAAGISLPVPEITPKAPKYTRRRRLETATHPS